MPKPCHYCCQNYDLSMLYPVQAGSEGRASKMCADEVNDEERVRGLLDPRILTELLIWSHR